MKTVKKTLDILEVFLNSGKDMSISDLAKITGQNISTIHGILFELIQRGYISQKEKRGKYSLGLKFLRFSGAINKVMSIEDIVNPFITELNKTIDETVNVAILNGRLAVNIAIIQSNHRLRVVTNENIGTPLYCTGIGKILLSGMNDADLEQYLQTEELITYTKNTIIDPAQIKAQIHLVSQDAFATDEEEYEIGVRNIAAPIKDHTGKIIAAIGILAPSIRLTKARIKKISPILKQCAMSISLALGYSEPVTAENLC